jgi:hypothetical protein
VSAGRTRLAALAAAAGSPSDLLVAIAAATIPRLPVRAGPHRDVEKVASAVAVLACAGITADALPELVAALPAAPLARRPDVA